MSKRSSNLISPYISSLVPNFKFSFPIKGVLWIIENKGWNRDKGCDKV
jgi:hypothetical protein